MAQHNARYARAAARAVDHVIANGRECYDRRRMLPRVLPVGPDEISGVEPENAPHRVKAARALRTERARGRASHWTHDLNRHIALMQAMKAEQQRLAQCARDRLISRILD
jgi:hypothetical protein